MYYFTVVRRSEHRYGFSFLVSACLIKIRGKFYNYNLRVAANALLEFKQKKRHNHPLPDFTLQMQEEVGTVTVPAL